MMWTAEILGQGIWNLKKKKKDKESKGNKSIIQPSRDSLV